MCCLSVQRCAPSASFLIPLQGNNSEIGSFPRHADPCLWANSCGLWSYSLETQWPHVFLWVPGNVFLHLISLCWTFGRCCVNEIKRSALFQLHLPPDNVALIASASCTLLSLLDLHRLFLYISLSSCLTDSIAAIVSLSWLKLLANVEGPLLYEHSFQFFHVKHSSTPLKSIDDQPKSMKSVKNGREPALIEVM